MFHQGDLQSGVTLALQEAKSVVCLVRDEGDESATWENDWLQHQNIPHSLERQAVALRLDAGSQEASFLSAFCPVTHVPTLVVIYQGQLVEQLNSGLNKNDFTLRLLRAINRSLQPATGEEQIQTTTATTAPSQDRATASPPVSHVEPTISQPEHPPSLPQPVEEVAAPPSAQDNHSTPERPQPSPTPEISRDLFSDRRARMEAQRKTQEAAEKAKQAERAKARQQDAAAIPSSSSSPRSAQQLSYAQQQVQRKREAKEERNRILKLVENDKQERKEREERRRALAQAELSAIESTSISTDTASSAPVPGSTSHCALQTRLLDGSTLRQTFPATATLTPTVRGWLDAARTDGSTPYTFKQILTPLPSRALTLSDESETLASLGLAPSATLVLVPVPGASVSAFGGRGGGRDSLFAGYVVAMITAVVDAVYTMLALVPRGAQRERAEEGREGEATQAEAEGKATGVETAAAGGVKIRTLRDAREERDEQQLYNGNQINVEPNRKGDKEEEGGGS